MGKEVMDALIVGAGFAGIGSAIQLKKSRFDFILLEKNPNVGGVWYANTYPGAQCDVQSHLYSYSFEPNPYWSRTYGLQEEILNYLEYCAEKYEILPNIRFNTKLLAAEWKEREMHWEFYTSKGDTLRARNFFLTSGGLSQPLKPDFPGVSRFGGIVFHSAEWDHSVDLSGKRVSVIGSAASAVQIVPAIVDRVRELNLFQRTPNWILPKDDKPYSHLEMLGFRLFPLSQSISREWIYWQLEWRAIAFVYFPQIMELAQKAAEKYIQDSIQDPELRKIMTPKYKMGCKRILLSNDFYSAIQRPNARVIPSGIQEFTEKGIRTMDGREIESDVVLMATGFKVAEGLVPFQVRGRNGVDLNDTWRDGPEAYLGTTIKGYPNLFMIPGPNTGLGHSSMVYMIESQIQYALDGMQKLRKIGKKAAEVKSIFQEAYNEEIQKKLAGSVWNTGGCNSWYKNSAGKNVTLWPGFTFEFRNRTATFNLEDYILN